MHTLKFCGDLNVVALFLGLQLGYINFFYFIFKETVETDLNIIIKNMSIRAFFISRKKK